MPLSDVLQGLLGTGATLLLQNDAIQSAEDVGDQALELTQGLNQQIQEQSRFTPFAVTTGAGTIGSSVDELGRTTGLNLNVSPESQALMSQTFGDSLGMLGRAAGPVDDRVNQFYEALGLGGQQARSESDIFNMMESILQPSRERDRLALEGRLFSQGRDGLRTSAFGGAPEQLALEKAIEESRSGNLFNAFNLANQERLNRANIGTNLFNTALGEQAQNASIGGQLLSSAFAPTEHLLNAYRTGLEGAGLGERSRLQRIADRYRLAGKWLGRFLTVTRAGYWCQS